MIFLQTVLFFAGHYDYARHNAADTPIFIYKLIAMPLYNVADIPNFSFKLIAMLLPS